jgi:LacI family transcriptional regulator
LIHSETPSFSFQPHDLFQGLVEAAHAAGCHLEVTIVPDERLDNEAGLLSLIQEFAADGLLINYHLCYPRALPELIERLPVPAVWINSLHRHDAVMPGDFDAGVALTKHLIDLGHRRIAYADLTSDFTALERLDGYKQAMKQADLPTHLIGAELPLDVQEQASVARESLAAHEAPTAILGYCPRSIMPFYHAALGHLHKTLPRDLSLASFVNEEHEISGLNLTRMSNPWLEIGHAAVTRLVARCAQPGKRFDPLMVPMRLIPGSTCAPLHESN